MSASRMVDRSATATETWSPAKRSWSYLGLTPAAVGLELGKTPATPSRKHQAISGKKRKRRSRYGRYDGSPSAGFSTMFRSHVPLAVHWEANLPTATERPVIRAGIPV